MSIRSCQSLQTVHKTISDQNRIAYDINNAQGQTLHRQLFTNAKSKWHFLNSLYMTMSLLQLLKGINNVRNMAGR